MLRDYMEFSKKIKSVFSSLRVRDIGYIGLLIFGSFNNDTLLYNTKKNYQNIATQLIENKDKKYVVISTKTRKFIDAMIKVCGLDKTKFVVVSAMQMGGIQDYMALCGTDSLILTVPVLSMQKLNKFLKKGMRRLSLKEKNELKEIEFFIGHELYHIKLCLDKEIVNSSLYLHRSKMHLTALIQGATWIALRVLGVDVWWQLYLGAYGLGKSFEYGKLYLRCIEESQCDLNASKKSEILKSGATALQHHCKEHTLAHAKQAWFGLLWPYFPELAYWIGTQHPSPDYRSQALLNKSQELENKKDVFVLA
jgi:hypothetical protein